MAKNLGTSFHEPLRRILKEMPHGTYGDIARKAGVSISTVKTFIKRNGIEHPGNVGKYADITTINGTTSAKAAAVAKAMLENPRRADESCWVWFKRLAPLAGCSASHVQHLVELERCAQVGREKRAQEEAEKANQRQVVKFDAAGLVGTFEDWITTFAKMKFIADHYRIIALQRGDVWAKAFCEEIARHCDNAIDRACKANPSMAIR